MKTPAERQDYLIANPVQTFNNQDKMICLMNAWLLSDLFRLNTWSSWAQRGVKEKRLAEQTTSILNRSNGIVWG